MQCPRHEFEEVYVDVMNDVALLTMNENENDENEDGKEFAWGLLMLMLLVVVCRR